MLQGLDITQDEFKFDYYSLLGECYRMQYLNESRSSIYIGFENKILLRQSANMYERSIPFFQRKPREQHLTPMYCNVLFNLAQVSLSLQYSGFNTLTSTLLLQHFHFNTFTSTLSLQHFHFNTFTSTLILQHSNFNTLTSTLLL